nr:bifunctional phosphopantothenoylcysteine decarboxylase/phosphopantothenate--cysteine ligase CoaBC [bacterium]
MQGKCVVLGVTGGIAAYKAAEIVSTLKKRGVDVWCVMTENATRILPAQTLETLSGHPVAVHLFQREAPWEVEHIALAQRADVFLIAPATANFLGKMAGGIADDMLTTTVMATRAPVLIAPAMNTAMWENAATQHNVAVLASRGVRFVQPASGRLACGDIGVGKLADVGDIIAAVEGILCDKKDLTGARILVTAGPTREPLDPVRFLSNHSSGKMGYELARRAQQRGAEVVLVSGPVNLAPPPGVEVVGVQTAQQMYESIMQRLEGVDAVIKAAAPADFTAQTISDTKIKKQPGQQEMVVRLVVTPDIAKAVGEKKGNRVLVCFAAETGDGRQNALDKLVRKHADYIVLNDVTRPGAGFGVDTNIATIYGADGTCRELELMPKSQLADCILDTAKDKILARVNGGR